MGHARDGALATEGQTHVVQTFNSKRRAVAIWAGKQKTRHVAGGGMCAGSM